MGNQQNSSKQIVQRRFFHRAIKEVKNDKEKALKLFQNYVDIYPEDALAWYNLGLIKHELQDSEGALTCYNTAINLTNHEKSFYRRSILKKECDIESSMEDINQAIEMSPKSGRYYHLRGHLFYQMEMYEEALKNFDLAIKNKEVASKENRCLTLLKLGRYDDVQIQYKELVNMKKSTLFEVFGSLLRVDLLSDEIIGENVEVLHHLFFDPNQEDIWELCLNRLLQYIHCRLDIQQTTFPLTRISYDTTKIIGVGAYGTVYEGFFNSDKKNKIAVKILHFDILSDHNISKFLQEAEWMERLCIHQNLVNFKGTFTDLNTVAIAMEKEESSLKDFLERDIASLSQGKILRILKDISLGLHFLHLVPIIHRDLKPGNILIGKKGNAKIADLGISRLIREPKLSILTKNPGTFYYSSLECSTENYDEKIDLWSFGLIVGDMYGPIELDVVPEYRSMVEELDNEDRYYINTVEEGLGLDIITDKLKKRKTHLYHISHVEYDNSFLYNLALRCLAVNPNSRINSEILARSLFQ